MVTQFLQHNSIWRNAKRNKILENVEEKLPSVWAEETQHINNSSLRIRKNIVQGKHIIMNAPD